MSKEKRKSAGAQADTAQPAENPQAGTASQAQPQAENQTESQTEPSEQTQSESQENPLEKELAELKAKYQELNDSYLRSRAEFENYRKRTLAEKAELIKNGGEKTLCAILPVVDDFERGLQAMENVSDVASLKEGMTLVYNKMQTFLSQSGVKAIEAVGQEFNTDEHEAITMIPAPDESQKGKVIDCIQKGYYLNEKVIRFAKVVVGN